MRVLLSLVMVLHSWITTALVDDEWWDPDENEASKDEKEAEEAEKDTEEDEAEEAEKNTEEDDIEEKKEAEKDTEEKKEAEDTEEKKEAEDTEEKKEAEETEKAGEAEEAEMKKAEEEAEEKKAEEKKAEEAEEKADPDDDWTDWFRARTVGTNSDGSRGAGAGAGSSSERKKQFKRPTEGPTEGGDCHAQGPCHDGFMDVFDGDYMMGSCGPSLECEGSAPYVLFDVVNGECICACQSAPETCQSLSGYDDFNVYRFVPMLSFFRYFGWIGDYVAGALVVAVIIALCGASRKFYANRVQKPYVGLKVYDSEVDSVEDGNESGEEML